MSHLTIVADDSPLQHSCRSPQLSENGWELCGDSVDGEVVSGERSGKRPVVIFPAPTEGIARLAELGPEDSPWLVITVHKESRLLQYQSHYRSAAGAESQLAPVVKASIYQIVPSETKEQAEVLASQLDAVERQCSGFYKIDVANAIAIAVHSYRQRRRQDILAELDELKRFDPTQ